jgi:hypothetical protein
MWKLGASSNVHFGRRGGSKWSWKHFKYMFLLGTWTLEAAGLRPEMKMGRGDPPVVKEGRRMDLYATGQRLGHLGRCFFDLYTPYTLDTNSPITDHPTPTAAWLTRAYMYFCGRGIFPQWKCSVFCHANGPLFGTLCFNPHPFLFRWKRDGCNLHMQLALRLLGALLPTMCRGRFLF